VSSMRIDSTGKFLYVTSVNTGGKIAVYSITGTGALMLTNVIINTDIPTMTVFNK